MVGFTCWEQRPSEQSGQSCVCRSCADVCLLQLTCHMAGLLIPRVSHSLLAHLVPDMLPPWHLVNFCSLFSSPWPGILTCHVFPLLANLYFFTLFWLPEYLIPCLPWRQMTVSWSVFCLPGSGHHPGTLPFSCPSFPPHNLFKLGSEDGFTGSKSGSRLGLENGDYDPDVSIRWLEGIIHIHRERVSLVLSHSCLISFSL